MADLTIPAAVENMDQVLAFVDEALENLDCPMKAQIQIDIMVEELFVNIAHYAYPQGSGDATIRVNTDEDARFVEITFIDSGIPYDPLAKPDPDITLSAEERQIGGLGIYIVKKSMDDMKYKRLDGKNILVITKKLV